MSPAVFSSALPRRFGQYVLFDAIGRGGMSEIYLARQNMQLGGSRLCVVKQILPELAGDSTFSEMFVFEAKLAAALSHANVVQVFDLGRADDRLFIAMEYVEGFDISSLLGRCAKGKVALPVELAIYVVREALRGLDYAHRRRGEDGAPLGIVHRDVSPSNILLSFEGEVKVCDFGIARANDMISRNSAAHEVDEALRGKAGYMSPEHARGEPVDARADVFAAGIVLWELLAGRRMYRTADGAGSVLEQARRAEIPPPPTDGRPGEDMLRSIVSRALVVDRDARYASCAAMLRDLDEYTARTQPMTNPLRLGHWLSTEFGTEIIGRRRARERAMAALEIGVPLVATPIVPPPTTASDPPPQSAIATPRSPDAVAPSTRKRDGRGVLVAFAAAAVVLLGGLLWAIALR